MQIEESAKVEPVFHMLQYFDTFFFFSICNQRDPTKARNKIMLQQHDLLPLGSEALQMNCFHSLNIYTIRHTLGAKIRPQISFTPGYYLVP